MSTQLLQRDLLLREGTALEGKDAKVAATWAWGPSARFFHYLTQSVSYQPDLTAQRRSLIQHAKNFPPPSPYKDYDVLRLPLPDSPVLADTNFWKILRERRTRGRFARKPTRQELMAQTFWPRKNQYPQLAAEEG